MTFARFVTALSSIVLFALPAAAGAQSASDLFQRALRVERVDGDLDEAIRLYRQVVELDDRTLAARALLRIGESYERLGREGAEDAYRRLMSEFSDQAAAADLARGRLAALAAESPDRISAGSPDRPLDGVSLRLVWPDASDAFGSPTPDGKAMTFVDWSTNGLAVRNLATGDKRVLVTEGRPTYPLQSFVSNDGTRVAYHFIPGPWQPQLRVVGMDGTGERILLENATVEIDYITPLGWTPDDSEVLVDLAWMDGHRSLTFVSVADGSMRTVRSFAPPVTIPSVALSPDGRWIAYVRLDADNRKADISVLASDGSTERTMISHPANDMSPIWSPDGRHLLFASDRGGSVDLWAVRVSEGVADGEPFLVRRDIGAFSPLAFASDGSLFFVRDTRGGDIFTIGFDAQTGRVRGTPAHAVQVYQGHNSGGTWAPDGRRLAYASQRNRVYPADNKASLIVRDEASGHEFEPAPAVLLHPTRSQPSLSPDGGRIAAWGDLLDGGPAGVMIRLIDIADGTTRAIKRPGLTEICAFCPVTFSNDGTALFYYDVIHRPDWVPGDECPDLACVEYGGLFRHDITTDEYERVFAMDFNPDGDSGAWALSPDQTKIALLSRDPGGASTILRIGDPQTGTATRIATIAHDAIGCTPTSRNTSPAWTPDGSLILFVCARPGTDDGRPMQELMSIRVSGGPVQSTGLVMEEIRHMTVRPDGAIGFTAGPRRNVEVWVMSGLASVSALAGSR